MSQVAGLVIFCALVLGISLNIPTFWVFKVIQSKIEKLAFKSKRGIEST